MSPNQLNGVSEPFKQLNGSSETTLPLENLSWKITKNASIVSHYLESNHPQQPSLSSDGPSTIVPIGTPPHIQQARQNLISASLELLQLAIGPSEFLPNLALGFQYIACLEWLCQCKIFHLVPLHAPISYSNLATAAKIPEQRLKSIIRMAMTNTLFLEQPDGKHVAHSDTSALLASNEDLYAYATYMCAKSAPMAIHMTAANQRWGADTTCTYETAYNIAFDTDLPFFDHISRDKAKMGEFAKYMRNVRSSEGVNLKHLVSGFRWKDVREGGVVVDVGGSTVEDLPQNVESGRQAAELLTSEISSRLTFRGHNFMEPQPVQGADIYYLRMILHDWPDAEATKIINNIVAAMENKPNSGLLIMDTVLPVPGSVPVSVERIVRVRDLTMMQAFQ